MPRRSDIIDSVKHSIQDKRDALLSKIAEELDPDQDEQGFKHRLYEKLQKVLEKSEDDWPEYSEAIFQSDASVFSRLLEYVQRRLTSSIANQGENSKILKRWNEMDFPKKGCKMAITLKGENNKLYPDVIRCVPQCQ